MRFLDPCGFQGAFSQSFFIDGIFGAGLIQSEVRDEIQFFMRS